MASSNWRVVGLLLVAFAAGCGGGEDTSLGSGGTAGDGTTASTGGSGGTGSPTTTASTGGTLATTSSGGGAGGTGGSVNADCPEGGLYALSDTDLNEDVVSMCKYKGDVLLIVNIAEA